MPLTDTPDVRNRPDQPLQEHPFALDTREGRALTMPRRVLGDRAARFPRSATGSPGHLPRCGRPALAVQIYCPVLVDVPVVSGQCVAVAGGPTSTDFEPWFAGLTEGTSVERRALIRSWFLSLHEQLGAVTGEAVAVAWALQRLESAELAVALTLADVQRTTTWHVEVGLTTSYNDIEITVEGHTRSPATDADPWDQPAIVRDIAEIMQEDISEWRSQMWPSCTRHGDGVHAEVRAGRAVWWCGSGDHVVTEIGLLGL